jgi:hypothetical protein
VEKRLPRIELCDCSTSGTHHAYLYYRDTDGEEAKQGPFASVAVGLALINAGEQAFVIDDDLSGLHPEEARRLRGELQHLGLPDAETEYDQHSLHRDQVIFQALLMGVDPRVINLLDTKSLELILSRTEKPFDQNGPGGGVIWNRLSAIQRAFLEGDWPGDPRNKAPRNRLVGFAVVKM